MPVTPQGFVEQKGPEGTPLNHNSAPPGLKMLRQGKEGGGAVEVDFLGLLGGDEAVRRNNSPLHLPLAHQNTVVFTPGCLRPNQRSIQFIIRTAGGHEQYAGGGVPGNGITLGRKVEGTRILFHDFPDFGEYAVRQGGVGIGSDFRYGLPGLLYGITAPDKHRRQGRGGEKPTEDSLKPDSPLGGCRICALGFDFRPFHLLLCWKNAHLAQPNSAFSALHQAKIIENRPERPKPDSPLGGGHLKKFP